MIRKIFTLFFLVNAIVARAQELPPFSNNFLDTGFINRYIRETDRIANVDSKLAISRYETAMLMSKSINFYPATVYCLLKVSEYQFNQKKDYGKSLEYISEVISYKKKLTESEQWLLPSAYNLLASAYFKTGRNDSAIFYYSQAFELIDRFPNSSSKRLLIDLNSNMGSVLAASLQYRQGLHYIKEAIYLLDQVALTHRDSMRLASNFGNLGALYANSLNNMDSALFWWNQSISIYRALSMNQHLQDIYANIARGWMLLPHENMRLAALYLDTAILVDPGGADKNIGVQLGLGTLCYYNEEYAQAIKHAENALLLCNAQGIKERKKIAYSMLSYSYAYLNDSKESRKYELLYIKLSDSLLNEQITRSISSMEVRYRVAEKDKILAEKNKILAENKARLYQQRYWLAGSIGGGIILLLVLAGFVRNSRQKRRLEQERIQNLERQQKIDQLQVERETEERERKRIAQELHDGLGVLLSAAKINQTMLARVVPGAEGAKPFNESKLILSQMQQEVEWITNNLMPDYITENGLESALHTLAAKFNRPGVFDIHLESYGAVRELHPDRAFSLYRALEEILHNAVKHSGGNQLALQLMYHPDQLRISLEDNGKGFDTQLTYAGMGMQNIRNRIIGMGGIFELSSIPGKGTSYILQVPY